MLLYKLQRLHVRSMWFEFYVFAYYRNYEKNQDLKLLHYFQDFVLSILDLNIIKRLYDLFYGWGSTTSRLKRLCGGSLLFTFLQFTLNSWYSFYQSQKDERLVQLWIYSMILNTGPLDWESSVLNPVPNTVNVQFYICNFKYNCLAISDPESIISIF